MTGTTTSDMDKSTIFQEGVRFRVGIPIEGGFSDVEDSFDVLPAGVYDAVVLDGEVREAGPNAKHPGAQYIAWTFRITEPEFENRRAWLNTSLVPEAKPMLKRFLKAAGYTDDELNGESFDLDISDVSGRDVRLVLSQGVNPNTQEPNNSVKRVLPAGVTEGVGSDLP